MLSRGRAFFISTKYVPSYLELLNDRLIQSNVRTVNMVCAKYLSTTSNLFCIHNRGTRGNLTQEKEIDLKLLWKHARDPEQVKKGFKVFLNECKKWYEERQHDFLWNSRSFRFEEYRGVVDMLFTFEKQEDLKKFVVTTDSANNEGYSSASLKLTERGTALFSGYICTKVPKDGNVEVTGYANIMSQRKMKSFRRPGYYDFKYYSHLVLKVRGDGHTYGIILPCPGEYNVSWNNHFFYPMYTRGGPYWQIIKIPLTYFVFGRKGYPDDAQTARRPLEYVARFGITIANVYEGEFKLEIDYVGLEFKDTDKSVCPYERYATPKGVYVVT